MYIINHRLIVQCTESLKSDVQNSANPTADSQKPRLKCLLIISYFRGAFCLNLFSQPGLNSWPSALNPLEVPSSHGGPQSPEPLPVTTPGVVVVVILIGLCGCCCCCCVWKKKKRRREREKWARRVNYEEKKESDKATLIQKVGSMIKLLFDKSSLKNAAHAQNLSCIIPIHSHSTLKIIALY